GRDLAVGKPVDPAREHGPALGAGRVDVDPVDANRRRAREAERLRLVLRVHLLDPDLGRAARDLLDELLRLRIGRAAAPVQAFDLHGKSVSTGPYVGPKRWPRLARKRASRPGTRACTSAAPR